MLITRSAIAAALLLTLTSAGQAAPITRSFTLSDGSSEVVVNPTNGVVVWRTDGEPDNVFLLGHFLRAEGDSIDLGCAYSSAKPPRARSGATAPLCPGGRRLSPPTLTLF